MPKLNIQASRVQTALTTMYVNQEFFAAPLLPDPDSGFQKFAKNNATALTEFSNDLHTCLDVTTPTIPDQKTIGENRHLFHKYYAAILGPLNWETHKHDSKDCLLSNNLQPLKKLLEQNPAIVDVILKHRYNPIIECWYETQAKTDEQAVRNKRITAIEAKMQRLDQNCLVYQQHLLAEKDKLLDLCPRPSSISISYEYASGTDIRLPIKMQVHLDSQSNVDQTSAESIKDVATKYNKVAELRQTLYQSQKHAVSRLTQFQEIFANEGTQAIISVHRDSTGMRFLKNTAIVLSSLVFGAGLLLSYAKSNSFTFWRSEGEKTCSNLENILYSVPAPAA
ncbi:MAG: hypothetical protein AAGG80_01720 [Pseudomonadota bacterium]